MHVQLQTAADGYAVWPPSNLIYLLYAAHINLGRGRNSITVQAV